jgi:hypothetical protein
MLSRRKLVIVAAYGMTLCGLALTIRALLPSEALTLQETRFAGTYALTQPGATVPTTSIAFQPDRTCLYTVNGQPVVGLETDWEIVAGELRMANHYRVAPFRNAPLLPGARQTETVSWRLVPTKDPSTVSLTTLDGVPLGTLTRTE